MKILNKFFGSIYKFISNRLVILAFVVFVAFMFLIAKLYELQIVQGEFYLRNFRDSTVKTIEVSAPRGEIFDKYGVPLAVNETAFAITMDPQIPLNTKELNDVIYNTILLFEENSETYIDELPITKTEPFEYTLTEPQIETWKTDMAFSTSKYNYTATESYYYLLERFEIVTTDANGEYISDYPEKYYRSMLSIRSSLYVQRYRKYEAITLAYNVSEETVSTIEEQPLVYKSVHSTVGATRNYPQNKYVSHMLGYIMTISESEYETLSEENDEYTRNDIVGKDGLEKAFELSLKGKNGSQTVELNNVGKITNVLKSEAPEDGNDIYTTIDSELTVKTYDILEKYLKDLIIANLTTTNSRDTAITVTDFLKSFSRANNFLIKDILKQDSDSVSIKVYNQVNDYLNSMIDEYNQLSEKARDILSLTDEDKEKLNTYEYYLEYNMENQQNFSVVLGRAINEDLIAESDLLLMMEELEIITLEEETHNDLLEGKGNILAIIIDKLNDGEITPQMTNLDPSTGSIVILDVDTGDVISSVSYPSYDNNKLVNTFDNDYYYTVSQLDPTTPLLNRAFVEGRAPGSTFKMITAVTVLEESEMTPTTTIYDRTYFTEAGLPYPKCWSNVSHGSTNVSRALEVSCNYFFFKAMYDMGNQAQGNEDESIDAINKYMVAFGLDDRTGVEITELADFTPSDQSIISSPEYKRYIKEIYNPGISETELAWYDGDTVATGIGQAYNNYSAASMAKYIATLANDGYRLQLHFLDKEVDPKGNIVKEFETVVEEQVEMSEETYNAVLNGMRQVIIGNEGTGRGAFSTFPISIAAKTGTAEQVTDRSDHSSFAAFAPYENPEVAIYVLVPFGNSYNFSSPASKIAREVLDEYFKLNYEPELNVSTNIFSK
ncbi:MAG: penicillin-binding transpeptidase domain-containing protein [Lachnospirales bacterium]